MPISSQVPIIGYVANGVTKSFAFPFAILSADDLKVKVGADVVTTGFSIAGVGDRDGGSVTFTDAPASSIPIILYREVTLDRTTDYQENGDLLAIVLDDDLDRIWMALQDQLLLSDRALRSPLGETLQQLPPASERALMALAFDAAGNPIVVRGTNDGGAALALDLLGTAPGKGAVLVGYDDGTVQTVLDDAKPMANYTALRNYTGRATGVRITQVGLSGHFFRDASDTTSADNGGTIIADASGRRWKRLFDGAVNVKWFGALGNSNGTPGNGNDDYAAIQAALNYVEAMGGGTVDLPQSTGHYRITQGLKIGSFVTLQGPGVNRYPYNDDSSCIVEDFSDPMQWMVEPKTTVAGSPVGCNTIVTSFPSGPTYNCAVRDVQLRSNKAAGFAFGGIRLHGCPGSVISNVSVVGTGIGALINECYGGSYDLQTLTHYYGVAAWQEVNACQIKTYSGSINAAVKTVPAGYLLSFMSSLSTALTGGEYVLSTNTHHNRCWGFILGANSGDLSVGNTVDLTAEQFSGACLQLFASATNFIRFYEEGAAGNVDFGFVAAQSKSFCGNFHAFQTGSGTVFDVGAQSSVDIHVNGLFNYASFGTVYLSPDTRVILRQCAASSFGATLPIQYNVSVSDDAGAWVSPVLLNSWANVGGVTANYKRNGKTGNIEIKGRVGGGALNNAIFNLPAGSRPGENRLFAVASNNGASLGAILINTAGDVIPTAGVTTDISLAGITFQAEA